MATHDTSQQVLAEVYRAARALFPLDESEETMNCSLTDIVCTARDGRVSKMDAGVLGEVARSSAGEVGDDVRAALRA